MLTILMMEDRLVRLSQVRKDANLSLREAGELDAIRKGFGAWVKHEAKWNGHKKPRNGERTNVGDPNEKNRKG